MPDTVSRSCEMAYKTLWGEALPCGKKSIARCADCGSAICDDCRVECCGESLCDGCYVWGHEARCSKKPVSSVPESEVRRTA
jgi:hypothetical protein